MKFFNKNSKKTEEKNQEPEPFLIEGEVPSSTIDKVNLAMLKDWEIDEENIKKDVSARIFGAAQQNLPEAMQLGLDAKIPWDLVDDEGYTLLTKAARCGSAHVVEQLLNLKFNPAFCPPGKQFNAFQAAAAGGHYELAVMLMLHPSNKVNKDMLDKYGQSILQIAISRHQFEFARRWMQEQNPNLSHVDTQKRSALATALGCYYRESFNLDIEKNNRLDELSDFCLEMLTKENAFIPVIPNAKSAIDVVLHTQLALNLEPGEKAPATQSTPMAVSTLALNAPKVAKVLLTQANTNPVGKASSYIAFYGKIDSSITTVGMAVKNSEGKK